MTVAHGWWAGASRRQQSVHCGSKVIYDVEHSSASWVRSSARAGTFGASRANLLETRMCNAHLLQGVRRAAAAERAAVQPPAAAAARAAGVCRCTAGGTSVCLPAQQGSVFWQNHLQQPAARLLCNWSSVMAQAGEPVCSGGLRARLSPAFFSAAALQGPTRLNPKP